MALQLVCTHGTSSALMIDVHRCVSKVCLLFIGIHILACVVLHMYTLQQVGNDT